MPKCLGLCPFRSVFKPPFSPYLINVETVTIADQWSFVAPFFPSFPTPLKADLLPLIFL